MFPQLGEPSSLGRVPTRHFAGWPGGGERCRGPLHPPKRRAGSGPGPALVKRGVLAPLLLLSVECHLLKEQAGGNLATGGCRVSNSEGRIEVWSEEKF